jgi:DNA-binding beta-propeller fold protein YncE
MALSGLAVFTPSEASGAERSPVYIDLPSPQFAAWTPDSKLLVTFISQDGSYGILQRNSIGNDFDRFLSVGTATGQFNWPQGIAVSGSIAYIVDSNNGRIQRLDLESRKFLEPFGGLGKKSGLFLRPCEIFIFENEIFVADTRNHRIQVFSLDGVVKRVFGELGDANDQFRLPTSCAVSTEGEVFVVDSKHSLIKVFGLDGRFMRKFGGFSSARKEPGFLSMPTGISLGSDRNKVVIASIASPKRQSSKLGRHSDP